MIQSIFEYKDSSPKKSKPRPTSAGLGSSASRWRAGPTRSGPEEYPEAPAVSAWGPPAHEAAVAVVLVEAFFFVLSQQNQRRALDLSV